MSASAERLKVFRDAMARAGIDAFLVRDTSNIFWLTSFDDVFDEERAHALFVAKDACVLHTDSRYALACEAAVAHSGAPIEICAERVSHAQFAARLIDRLFNDDAGASFKVGIENSMTIAEYRALTGALKDVPVAAVSTGLLQETNDYVISLRAVKDAREIKRLICAQALTDAAFAHIISFIKPGMTEREVQVELEHYMCTHGASGLAFSSIVATGANGANPHAIPGDTLLESGQCAVMDFGAKVGGYCSDMTRMVFLGEPTPKMRDAYAVLREANETVEAALRPGMSGAEAQKLAGDVLARGGFENTMGHGLGHGVGIDIHELPMLNSKNDAPLECGNVVTVEPGIYLSGEFGMRLEDFGMIRDTGFEVFSQSSHEMTII